jgi:hypothetical protein
MKNTNKLGIAILVMVIIAGLVGAFTLTSCEGPEGPIGSQGEQGEQGGKGNDGLSPWICVNGFWHIGGTPNACNADCTGIPASGDGGGSCTHSNWGMWITIVDADCTENDGAKMRICNVNPSHVEFDSIPFGHNYTGWAETRAATCTVENEETGTCSRAGCPAPTDTRSTEAALGHDWDHPDYNITQAATCMAVGSKTRSCQRGGCATPTDTVEIPVDNNAHQWRASAEDVMPTATAQGYYQAVLCNHNTNHVREYAHILPMGIHVTDSNGATLVQKLDWLDNNAEANATYTVIVTADESITNTQTLNYINTNVTVNLVGFGTEKTITRSGNGSLFVIQENATLALHDNITLKGHNSNDNCLVFIANDNTLIMNTGAKIIGNTNSSSGGGVRCSGTFIMNGGEISGNTGQSGGGVRINNDGTFTINGGTITGNNAQSGGGVLVGSGATFNNNGGSITGNTLDDVYSMP